MATSILIKDLPDKIFKEIVKEQQDHQLKYSTIISQSNAVIKMLRDYIKCKNENNFRAEQ